MAKLIVFLPDEDAEVILRDPVTFGPGDEAMPLPESPFLAEGHAVLREENSRWYIKDGVSPWGTYVNGRRVHEQCLSDGDEVEFGLGGPRLRFEAEQEERLRETATTAGRLKQYYEQAIAEPEPLEGAGKIAVPVAARGVLFAIGGIALVALGAFWVGGRAPTVPDDVGETPATAPGGTLYGLQRASLDHVGDPTRLESEAQRERDGGPRRSRAEEDLERVDALIAAGVDEAGVRDSLVRRRDELQASLQTADQLSAVASTVEPGVVMIQTGFEADGRYFPGPVGTGFVVADGVIASRAVIEPEIYIRTADEVGFACALKDLADRGVVVTKVISVWAAGSTPALRGEGGLDPASATASTSDGSVEETGMVEGSAGETRSFGCPSHIGGLVESHHADENAVGLTLLQVSGMDAGVALPLSRAGARAGDLILLAGYPRGAVAERPLSLWSSYAPVIESGDRIVFEVPVLTGTDGAPILDRDGRVIGVGVANRDGHGVALPIGRLGALVSGS